LGMMILWIVRFIYRLAFPLRGEITGFGRFLLALWPHIVGLFLDLFHPEGRRKQARTQRRARRASDAVRLYRQRELREGSVRTNGSRRSSPETDKEPPLRDGSLVGPQGNPPTEDVTVAGQKPPVAPRPALPRQYPSLEPTTVPSENDYLIPRATGPFSVAAPGAKPLAPLSEVPDALSSGVVRVRRLESVSPRSTPLVQEPIHYCLRHRREWPCPECQQANCWRHNLPIPCKTCEEDRAAAFAAATKAERRHRQLLDHTYEQMKTQTWSEVEQAARQGRIAKHLDQPGQMGALNGSGASFMGPDRLPSTMTTTTFTTTPPVVVAPSAPTIPVGAEASVGPTEGTPAPTMTGTRPKDQSST